MSDTSEPPLTRETLLQALERLRNEKPRPPRYLLLSQAHRELVKAGCLDGDCNPVKPQSEWTTAELLTFHINGFWT